MKREEDGRCWEICDPACETYMQGIDMQKHES